jgi:hypothetical protein
LTEPDESSPCKRDALPEYTLSPSCAEKNYMFL